MKRYAHSLERGAHAPRVRRLTPSSTAAERAIAQRQRAVARVVPDRGAQSGARGARALPIPLMLFA